MKVTLWALIQIVSSYIIYQAYLLDTLDSPLSVKIPSSEDAVVRDDFVALCEYIFVLLVFN